MDKVKKFFQHLFMPTETNNYRAKSLHTDFLMMYLVMAFFISIAFKKIDFTNVLGFATDISVDKLFQLTNEERGKNSLTTLTYNDKLSAAAYQKAQDMFAKNYWAHFSPDGKTPWDFILNSGYSYEYAGENLAKNFLFSDGVVSAWMNSPSHRENILKSNYTDVGFAIVNGTLNGEQTTLVVQMFGKPNTSPIAQAPQVNQPQINLNNQVQAEEIEKTAKAEVTLPENKNPNPSVLSKNTNNNSLNYTNFAFNTNLVFFSFLLLALALDFYFVARFHIIRVGGKNIAHFIFVFFVLIGLLLITKGAII